MVKVKSCPRIALPPPDVTLPPPPPLIPTSVVTLKTVPSAPSTPSKPLCVPPPNKKSSPPPPFIRGQVGRKFFSLIQPRSCSRIPIGCSLIIASYRKALPHENVNSKFIIIDPFGNTWSAPKVFDVWWEEIETKALNSDEFVTHRIAIVRDDSNFFLAFSNRKTHVNNVTQELQRDLVFSDDDAFPNADSEDEREKRDPDFLPGDESN